MKITLSRIVSNIVTDVVNEPIKMARSMITSALWYTVDISNFRWSIRHETLNKYFRHIPGCMTLEGIDNEDLDPDYAKLPNQYLDAYVFNGTTIWFTYQCVENTTQSDGSQLRLTMSLKVLYSEKNKQNLRLFIKQLVRDTKDFEKKKSKNLWRNVCGQACIECNDRPHRSFRDVFIPKSQRDQIITAVTKFNDSEKWYKDHKIPYHFGIMLHGEPGTGKSSVVQAILELMDCDVFYLAADELMTSIKNDHWIRWRGKDRVRVVIIEDIDTNAFTINRKAKDPNTNNNFVVKQPVSIGSLLNFMDGFGSPDKVIYIMTTNHLKDLDPALIRPGRIDLSLEIGYLTDETFADFIRFHYGTNVNTHVRDGITCADLQTKVMEGWTCEQICDYVK